MYTHENEFSRQGAIQEMEGQHKARIKKAEEACARLRARNDMLKWQDQGWNHMISDELTEKLWTEVCLDHSWLGAGIPDKTRVDSHMFKWIHIKLHMN
eukprot:SAG22_NODE_12060_length_457_cov_13.762570_1_plen_98_part_00